MSIKTFKEIRKEYPDEYLILIDPEEKALDKFEVEITGARAVEAYGDHKDMANAYWAHRARGNRVSFATPAARERLVIDRVMTNDFREHYLAKLTAKMKKHEYN